MTCEQEDCPFWDGFGCPCATLDISEDERERQKRVLGIETSGQDVEW